jgi:hypothetical protein
VAFTLFTVLHLGAIPCCSLRLPLLPSDGIIPCRPDGLLNEDSPGTKVSRGCPSGVGGEAD